MPTQQITRVVKTSATPKVQARVQAQDAKQIAAGAKTAQKQAEADRKAAAAQAARQAKISQNQAEQKAKEEKALVKQQAKTAKAQVKADKKAAKAEVKAVKAQTAAEKKAAKDAEKAAKALAKASKKAVTDEQKADLDAAKAELKQQQAQLKIASVNQEIKAAEEWTPEYQLKQAAIAAGDNPDLTESYQQSQQTLIDSLLGNNNATQPAVYVSPSATPAAPNYMLYIGLAIGAFFLFKKGSKIL